MRHAPAPRKPPSKPTPTTFGFHHLNLTLIATPDADAESHAQLVLAIVTRWGHPPEQTVRADQVWARGRPWNNYRFSWRGPHQARLGAAPTWPARGGRQHLHLQLSGGFLEALPLDRLRGMLAELRGQFLALRCCRIDLAFDHCPFTPQQAWWAKRRGNLKLKSGQAPVRGDPMKKRVDYHTGGGTLGNTVEIGRPASARRVLLYDGRGFTRLELRLRQRWGQAAFEGLLGGTLAGPELAAAARRFVADFMSFVDRKTNKSVSRCAPLRWWSTFLNGAVAVRVPGRPRSAELERTLAWVQAAMRPIAMFAQLQPDPLPWLLDYFARGTLKLRPEDWALIHQARSSAGLQAERCNGPPVVGAAPYVFPCAEPEPPPEVEAQWLAALSEEVKAPGMLGDAA